MKFCKMNGLGNDYIYIDIRRESFLASSDNIVKLCDRHFGIGGDGVVTIGHSANADAAMVIYNKDGSRAEICGNALRSIGRYLYDNSSDKSNVLFIETDVGIKKVFIKDRGAVICVRLGKVALRGKNSIEIDGRTYDFYNVDIGNPHAVTFDEDFNIVKYGAIVSNYDTYPHKTNVEKVSVKSRDRLIADVYERGSGITQACGTGAASAAFCAMSLCAVENVATVVLPGGELIVKYIDDEIYIEGKVEYNYYGETDLC